MKQLEKKQMHSLYGGREVFKTQHTSNTGACIKDKTVVRNNGTIIHTVGPC